MVGAYTYLKNKRQEVMLKKLDNFIRENQDNDWIMGPIASAVVFGYMFFIACILSLPVIGLLLIAHYLDSLGY